MTILQERDADAETSESGKIRTGVRLGMLEGFVGMFLRLAYERSFDDFAALLGEDSLPPSYFTMLTLIANNPGITQVEVGRAAGRDKSSVTKALRYMEDAGLIRRVRLDDDRRLYASHITEAGTELHARMEEKARIHLNNLHSIIGEDRRQLFLETLKDLIKKLPDKRSP